MVGFRASSCDELVADARWEGQIGEPRMQVTELSAAKAEFEAAKTMLMRRDAIPARDRGADRLDRCMRGQELAAIRAGRVRNSDRVYFVFHG
jgi:hypothetical protein